MDLLPDMTDALLISFPRFLEEFNARYDAVFMSSSAEADPSKYQAFLDWSGAKVEGPRLRWRHILLVDCLLAISKSMDKTKAECTERAFDQYAAVHESIVTCSSEAIVSRMLVGARAAAAVPSVCKFIDIYPPWTDVATLKEYLIRRASQSWESRNEVVTAICDEELLQAMGIADLMHKVGNKIYSAHFGDHVPPAGYEYSTPTVPEKGGPAPSQTIPMVVPIPGGGRHDMDESALSERCLHVTQFISRYVLRTLTLTRMLSRAKCYREPSQALPMKI